MVKEFASEANNTEKNISDLVSFGDVDLSKTGIREGSPGQGGWPTIRYFNKETGIEGGSYVKKTSLPICQELGDIETMKAYVIEYSELNKEDEESLQGQKDEL